MFIHIGNDHVIRSRDIIAVVDYDVITSSTIMAEMVKRKQDENKVRGSSKEAKSVIITDEKIYFSTLSVITLQKRSSIQAMIQKFRDYSEEI